MSTQLSHVRTFIHEDDDMNIVLQHLGAAVVLGGEDDAVLEFL